VRLRTLSEAGCYGGRPDETVSIVRVLETRAWRSARVEEINEADPEQHVVQGEAA
jgi:hypothetical protein